MIIDFKRNFNKMVRRLREKRIVVVYGGFGDERSASLETGTETYQKLMEHGFNVAKIDPAKINITKFLDARKDLVLNCLHGKFGEDGRLSAVLDYLKVPYTFSETYASAVCMDKLLFKSILKKS
jgi:D-alanine-D-alanine ligase